MTSSRLLIVALGIAVGAGGAAAQGLPMPNYAQRCQPDQLRVGSMQDPCTPQIALFGLKGPTMVTGQGLDVEATGSVARNREGAVSKGEMRK